MKVVFQEKLAAAKIFKNVSNLREADQRYKRISLQQDFTRTEITAFNEKLKEAKEMNRNNGDETKYFVVRGPHTKLEIRKIESKHQGWGQVQLTKYTKYIPSTSTGQVLIFLKSTKYIKYFHIKYKYKYSH